LPISTFTQEQPEWLPIEMLLNQINTEVAAFFYLDYRDTRCWEAEYDWDHKLTFNTLTNKLKLDKEELLNGKNLY